MEGGVVGAPAPRLRALGGASPWPREVDHPQPVSVEVDSVDDDQHGGIAQFRVQPQLLRGEHHQQRLARSLEVPDQALLDLTFDHSLDDQVRALVLLVAEDDLDAAVFFVGGEDGEVLQDVQHKFWQASRIICSTVLASLNVIFQNRDTVVLEHRNRKPRSGDM